MSVQPTPGMRLGHCAVSMDNFVLIIGGARPGVIEPEVWEYVPEYVNANVIWSYNLYTGEWKSHIIPHKSLQSPPFAGAVAAAIDKAIYIFGGDDSKRNLRNAVWRLSRTKEGCFTWSAYKPQDKTKSPSPRYGPTGWAYAGRFWIFAGSGPSPVGYLNDNGDMDGSSVYVKNNQLLCFDPKDRKWTNPKCLGSIPTPRADLASAIISDKVWTFGGFNNNWDFLEDMYELSMSSLTWSEIETSEIHLMGRSECTLTVAADDKLVLHGGQTGLHTTVNDTWVMDLTSRSWKQFFPSKKTLPRRWHTGSTGLNNSVIIIGGIEDHVSVRNIVFNVVLEPTCKSLQHVAVQAIFRYRKELPLNRLPGKLLSLLDIFTKDQNVCS